MGGQAGWGMKKNNDLEIPGSDPVLEMAARILELNVSTQNGLGLFSPLPILWLGAKKLVF